MFQAQKEMEPQFKFKADAVSVKSHKIINNRQISH